MSDGVIFAFMMIIAGIIPAILVIINNSIDNRKEEKVYKEILANLEENKATGVAGDIGTAGGAIGIAGDIGIKEE